MVNTTLVNSEGEIVHRLWSRGSAGRVHNEKRPGCGIHGALEGSLVRWSLCELRKRVRALAAADREGDRTEAEQHHRPRARLGYRTDSNIVDLEGVLARVQSQAHVGLVETRQQERDDRV